MDHDVYTSNDAIGLVYVDLSPLLMRTADGDGEGRDLVVQGWFPLYDTLRGVRGALCLAIKVQTSGLLGEHEAGVGRLVHMAGGGGLGVKFVDLILENSLRARNSAS